MTLSPSSKLRLLILAAAALPAFAAGRYDGPGWAPLDPKPVLAAAAEVTAARYPNCDEVTVDEKEMEDYRPDGTGESQDEAFTKVLTEKGKRDNEVLSLSILLPYFTAEVVRLEVIKPDGQIVPVDIAANSQESIDSSQMQENIYDPNSRVLQVNIPGLEVGDIVHSVSRTVTERPIMPGEFADEALFEGRANIRHLSYEIQAPAARPLKRIELRDPVPGTVAYTSRSGPDGSTLHHWEVRDVPRMYDEPSMPPYEMVLQRLLVSTTSDWQTISRWCWELDRPHIEATSPEMRTTVAALTDGAASDLGKAKALFYYVSKQVRYMGITTEKDRPGFEPHDVRLTFAKKYGVCRDKAALLVAMLRLAGLKAYPVLIDVGTRLDPDVPDPSFNHEIAAVDLGQGGLVLMDPTDEHTRQLLPTYDENQSYLVCRPEGSGLQLSPITPPEKNMMRIETVGSLGGDGRLSATSELSFGGVNDDAYRGAFAEMKPDDRWRFFESHLQKVMPGAKLESLQLSPENMLDTSAPLRARIRFSAGEMAAFGGGKAIVSVPWIGKGFGIVNYLLDGTGLAQRKYPMETDAACGLEETISLRTADNFSAAVSLPSSSPVEASSVGYSRTFAFDRGTFSCSKVFKLKTVEFSPAQYLDLKQALAGMDYDDRKAPVLDVKAAPASAPAAALSGEPEVGSNTRILDDNIGLKVQDAHTAVLDVSYVEKILTYRGKISASDLKVPYNPSTERARLIRAAVVSPDGKRQEISPEEIHDMDQDWNASAKRYPGGKVLVANLPGVEIGSTLEVEYEVAMRDRPYVDGFSAFQQADPMAQKSFWISAPSGLALRHRDSGPAGLTTETESSANGIRTLTWKARDVAALPRETDLPPDWSYRGGVSFFVGDARAYLKALDAAMVARAGHGAKAVELARRLAAGAKDRPAALLAIRDEIAKSVRQAGPSFSDLPLSDLSDADVTLAEGYGHGADRAILTYAMLAGAGFKPEFVLASDLPSISEFSSVARSFPLAEEFKDPLVRVKADGQTYILNDTDEYARLGSTPHDGRLALALPSGKLETLRAVPGCESRVDTVYTISLVDDGTARIGIERRYYGMPYAEEKRLFSEMPPEEKNRYHQAAVSAVAQGARPLGDLTTQFDGYPGVAAFSVEIDRYGIADGKFLYFDLPFVPTLLATRTGERALPFYAPNDSLSTLQAAIALPPGYGQGIIVPRSARRAEPDGAGSVRITAASAPGKVVLTYRLEGHAAVISPQDYPQALQLESSLENKAARVLLFSH